MEDKNKKKSAFQIQQVEDAKKVIAYKTASEANVVSIFYSKPELLFDYNNLTLEDFTENCWKVYWQIAHDLIVQEHKTVLDDITVGLYLEKHPKLSAKYAEYGGYDTIEKVKEYINVDNISGYVEELNKWNAVLKLIKYGYPVHDKLSDFADNTIEQIYDEYEATLNHIFVNADGGVPSYNACSDIDEMLERLDRGESVGLPLNNADLLTKEIGGCNLGNIYGLGANSGVGKSTTLMNYLLPTMLRYNERLVLFINEEDESKVRRELIIWVANNVLHYTLPKHVLRDGGFDEETWKILRETAAWIKQYEERQNILIIPLEQYSVRKVIKLIKKYAALGVKYFALDTLKESSDESDEVYKTMTRDMVKLYDIVKPKVLNVCLWVTYQLGKASIKCRYYTNHEIGQAKSIVDVFSVNLMMRRPFQDEFAGGKREITYYKLEGKNGESKIPKTLERGKHYMITFIPKNRFGQADSFQIVSEHDFSTNINRDIGICNIVQDF